MKGSLSKHPHENIYKRGRNFFGSKLFKETNKESKRYTLLVD